MSVTRFPAVGAKPPLDLEWYHDITHTLETSDFVQGVMVDGGAVVVYGESNSGKTFASLDLALHVARGRPWFGRRVNQGGVIYCALEGSRLFRNRVAAWRLAHLDDGDQPTYFAAIQSSLNLLDPTADSDRLIEAVLRAADLIPVPVKLIVVDTLARAMAGGNENGPEDMGALVDNMDRIRAETGSAFAFVHHSKDAARGARGHSSLRAAIDTEIEVVDANGVRTATVVKQRDLPKDGQFSFTLGSVELGTNTHGETVTSAIVLGQDERPPAKAKHQRLSGNMQIGADMLRRALSHHGAPLPVGRDYPLGVQA